MRAPEVVLLLLLATVAEGAREGVRVGLPPYASLAVPADAVHLRNRDALGLGRRPREECYSMVVRLGKSGGWLGRGFFDDVF